MTAMIDSSMAHPVAAAVAEIEASLTAVADSTLWSMPNADLASVAATAGQAVSRLQGLLVRLVGEIDARELPGELGASSTTGWVRHRFVATVREARDVVAVARATRSELSATGVALTDGRLSLAQAAAICTAVQALPAGLDPGIRAAAEHDLIGRAAHFDAVELARLGAHILEVLAPEIGEALEAERLARAEERAHARRALWLTPDGHGLEWLRGQLDTEAAAILRAALDPLSAPRSSAADGPDLRTPAQRRADALVELARRALTGGQLPDTGGEPPQLTVTVSLRTLIEGLGSARLPDGQRLSAGAARRLAYDCQLIPAVLGGSGAVLDVGRAQRLFTGARRRALVLRDRGCAFPGCDRPPAWCDGHHIISWAQGGPTRLNNGVLLCGHHHTVVHRDNWTIRIAADGLPEFIAPAWIDPTGTPQRNHRHP